LTHWSDLTSNIHPAKDSAAKKAGEEEDIVRTAIWLSSKAGSFMDRKIVRIDGGRLLVLKGVIFNHDSCPSQHSQKFQLK
jgi:hypothetical protein